MDRPPEPYQDNTNERYHLQYQVAMIQTSHKTYPNKNITHKHHIYRVLHKNMIPSSLKLNPNAYKVNLIKTTYRRTQLLAYAQIVLLI